MWTDPATIATLLTAVLGGGFGAEVFRAWRSRHKEDRDLQRVDLDLFYPTWKEEMTRLHSELTALRQQIVRLSEEVARLGGDPLAIRYPIQGPSTEAKEAQSND